MTAIARWSVGLDALLFTAGNGGDCFVHRRAFRALLRRPPVMEDCLAFFDVNQATFEAAAATKIAEDLVGIDQNFHLNSRQIRRVLAGSGMAAILHDQVLDGQIGA